MRLDFYTSTVADGSMKSLDRNFASVLPARTAFLKQHDIEPTNTTLVQVVYESDDFCRYVTAAPGDKGDGITRDATIAADAVVVTEPGHALFLPLADCIGAVIHDPLQNILMLSHLGRHNLEQFGGTKSIEYLVAQHGCDPQTLTVWLSPAASKASYPLFAFENRSLHDVATQQLLAGGIRQSHISASSIDVAVDDNYFSHSQFLQGNKPIDGRHAVVAVLRAH